MLDLKIFGLDAEYGEIIGQKQVVGSTAKGIDTGIDYFATEWRNSEICTVTTYDNGETYHEACWLTDFYWVEEPLETIIIDQNSGGGGGGYTPLPPGVAPFKIPCAGNPIANRHIAPQKVSKKPGGTFSDKYRKYENDLSNKPHTGLDIATTEEQALYAMYPGTVAWTSYNDNLGYYVMITSQINGQTITYSYSHLQKNSMPGRGTQVEAGTVVGNSGTSGNLAEAIRDGYAVQHTHIEAWVGEYKFNKGPDARNDLSKKVPNHIDPMKIMTTKFNANLNPINPC